MGEIYFVNSHHKCHLGFSNGLYHKSSHNTVYIPILILVSTCEQFPSNVKSYLLHHTDGSSLCVSLNV